MQISSLLDVKTWTGTRTISSISEPQRHLSLLLLSLFKSNMSVERRLAHKFSLTCHNRFIAGCCRSGEQRTGTCTLQKVHTLLGLNRLPWSDFLIPWALLWSQIFGQAQPLPAGSGQVGGRGLGWPDPITTPTLPRYGEVERRVEKKEGWGDRTKLASVDGDLVWALKKQNWCESCRIFERFHQDEPKLLQL